jgi:hypothetical protein
MSYPEDFPAPTDQGGPGAGHPVGGFGGNPALDRTAHRAMLERVGKAPVLLVHGNGGEASTRPWDMLDLKRMLLAAGYAEELIWAPSYLGPGTADRPTPHTNNVNDVRDYLDVVCQYLGAEVVDIIAHSLGCSLMYAVGRGLDKRSTPLGWDRPKKWSRMGTFVALAGGFHGLGGFAEGEWKTGGPFMVELLGETQGGGGETPFGPGKPPTPAPSPHNVTYFCGVARGDFIDASNPGTGRLAGATNRDYNLGPSVVGHERIKESQVVFNDFLPLLNSVPPVPAVKMAVDKGSGAQPSPVTIKLTVQPASVTVDVVATRLTRTIRSGLIVDDVSETHRATLRNGQVVTLATPGMWELAFGAAGAVDDLTRTYWVDIDAITTTIATDAAPFDASLVVMATTSDPAATIYHSLDGALWNEGATVTITQDTAVSFFSINPTGIASEITSRSFRRRAPWDDATTSSAVSHFIAGRIDVAEYLAYTAQFGYFTPFTLYRVHGQWVLDPDQPSARAVQPSDIGTFHEGVAAAHPLITVPSGDPQPGQHNGPVTVAIEAADIDNSVAIHCTRDGSIPDGGSPSFTGRAQFEMSERGNHVIACYARHADGSESYQAFPYTIW